jgi:hypothetical protein
MNHRRHERVAEGRGIRRRGAGNAREHHRCHHVGMRHAAPHPADQSLGESNEVGCDARPVHDLAGQDEERHGEEGKEVEPGEHAVRRHRQEPSAAHIEDANQPGDAEDKADRHAEEKKAEKGDGDDQHLDQTFARSAAVMPSSAKKSWTATSSNWAQASAAASGTPMKG